MGLFRCLKRYCQKKTHAQSSNQEQSSLLHLAEQAVFEPGVIEFSRLAPPPSIDLIRVSDKRNMFIYRGPGSLTGTEFRVQKCSNCVIVLLDNVSAISVDDCENCDFVLSAASQSTFIRSTKGCRFALATAQCRTRDLTECSFFLLSKTDPIIENCSDLIFSPFNFRIQVHDMATVPQLIATLNSLVYKSIGRAGLNPLQNRYERIYNFTPDAASSPYKILLRPTNIVNELEKPPVLPLTQGSVLATNFTLESSVIFAAALSETYSATSASSPISLSCGIPHSLQKASTIEQDVLMGSERVYLSIEIPFSIVGKSVSQDDSPELLSAEAFYNSAALWWSQQFFGLLLSQGLYIRQVFVAPTGVLGAHAHFVISLSGKSNTMSTAEALKTQFIGAGLTNVTASIVGGSNLEKISTVLSEWQAALNLLE